MLALSKLGRIVFRSPCDLPIIQEKEYKKIAEDALQNALSIVESGDWKKEKIVGDDIIYTKVIPKYGKVFKFVGTIHMSPEDVIEALYFKGEEMHKWNPTVKKVRVVQRIDDNVDIAHVIATEGAAGLVSSRDFVNLRIWKKSESGYIHGTIGTTHPDVPVISNYVRGEQGPGVYIITPETAEDHCKLQWLLNTNLKLHLSNLHCLLKEFWQRSGILLHSSLRVRDFISRAGIPQYLIDQTLSTVMLEYIQSLRQHHEKTKSTA